MDEFKRYGELDETVFDTPVRRRGTSWIITISNIRQMMGLEEGEMVRVKICKLPKEGNAQKSGDDEI